MCKDKKVSGKSKDEQMAEKKQELEKRLQDVTGQLGSAKKAAKKGESKEWLPLQFEGIQLIFHFHFSFPISQLKMQLLAN